MYKSVFTLETFVSSVTPGLSSSTSSSTFHQASLLFAVTRKRSYVGILNLCLLLHKGINTMAGTLPASRSLKFCVDQLAFSKHCLESLLSKVQSIKSLLIYSTKHSYEPSRTDRFLQYSLSNVSRSTILVQWQL